jgi:hypothetical protein
LVPYSSLNGNVPYEWIPMARDRDIDYAAVAVKKAIEEKFRDAALEDLQTVAGERMILIHHAGRKAEGSRDDFLAAVRKATSYANFWEILENDGLAGAGV